MKVNAGVIEKVGYVAAFCTTTSFVPQLVRVLRLRSARDISLPMFLMFSFGVFLWVLYGFWVHSLPVFVANGLTLILSLSILVLKLRFDRDSTRELKP